MNIEEAAVETGLNVEAVRSLASKGLVTPDPSSGGYDAFRIAQLTVAKRAMELGVAEEEIAALLSFFKSEAEATAALQEAVEKQRSDINAKLEELNVTREQLEKIAGAA